jgi:AbrB family looped-hinge helix DNA binding protein
MTTLHAKVTSKGQVTLPKQLRTKLAIRSGDRLEFELDKPDRISVRKKRAPGSSAGCGKQFIGSNRKAVTMEDMDAGIRSAVSQNYKSSLSDK